MNTLPELHRPSTRAHPAKPEATVIKIKLRPGATDMDPIDLAMACRALSRRLQIMARLQIPHRHVIVPPKEGGR